MNLIDFFIGLTLVNALPHFVLGTWRANMLSAFGFGHLQNKGYGMLNLSISIALFAYNYGLVGFLDQGMYLGGLTVVMVYMLTGSFWRDFSNTRVGKNPLNKAKDCE